MSKWIRDPMTWDDVQLLCAYVAVWAALLYFVFSWI